MEEQARGVTIFVAAAMLISFCACNRVQGRQSVQAATGVIAQPAPQKGEPTAPAQTGAAPGLESPPPASSASGSVAAPKSNAPPPKVVVSETSQTFTVAQHTFRLLTHVQRIEATATQPADETVEWWELRNARNQVVYRQAYPVAFQNGGFESTVAISASSFVTHQGSGVLVQGMDLPSAPDSGGWLQVFGFKYGRDKYGTDESLFGPFGAPISIEGEFLGIGTDPLRPTPTSTRGAMVTTMSDILKFRVWTGNFNIVYPILINWITGKLLPAWRCIEATSKGPTERCSYPIQVEAHRENQATFVRLFPQPDDGFTPKHIIVQPETKIEYLEARTPVAWSEDADAISFRVSGDVWLKVRIDGQEGWIHSEEDFEAVGLPQAG